MKNDRYNEAKSKRELDVVLRKNPLMELNLMRALYYKKHYGMSLSVRLREILINMMLTDSELPDKIFKSQRKHYGLYKLSLDEIKKALEEVKMSVVRRENLTRNDMLR